jgi:hypothetical protein
VLVNPFESFIRLRFVLVQLKEADFLTFIAVAVGQPLSIGPFTNVSAGALL